MGRFILRFEDQSRPLRAEKDIAKSFFFVLRTTLTIVALGCLVSVVSSFVTGDNRFLIRLIEMVRWDSGVAMEAGGSILSSVFH